MFSVSFQVKTEVLHTALTRESGVTLHRTFGVNQKSYMSY